MAKYQYGYDPDSSYGSAVALVESADLTSGVVLDLGCGYAAVAGPISELGLEYVGVDVSEESVAVLRDQGIDAHVADLARPTDELLVVLRGVLDGRALAAVLALDSLEHLPEPEQLLVAVRALVPDGSRAPLIVSYPNVTHFDVAANLMAGRWRRTNDGLLDRTHLQFRDEGGLRAMMASTGWHEDAIRDVIRTVSDQATPSDSPMIRPGAPLNELLRRIREQTWPTGSVFQFVRRYRPGAVVDPEIRFVDDEGRPTVGVVVVVPDALPLEVATPLLADLVAQVPPVDDVEVVRADEAPTALRRRTSRWVTVLQATTRLDSRWSRTLHELGELAPGRVLRVGLVGVDEPTRSALPAAPLELDDGVGEPVVLDALDPLAGAPQMDVVVDAYAVPMEVLRSAGIRPEVPGVIGVEWVTWLSRCVQVSGILGTSTPRVAAALAGLVPPKVCAEQVVADLDAAPVLLPAGSAGRLLDLQRRLAAAEAELAQLRALRGREEELRLLHAEGLQRVPAAPPRLGVSLLSRLYSWLERLTSRGR